MFYEETSLSLPDISLEDQLTSMGPSFHDKLFELIDKAHLDNKDVWKRANLDRKLFLKFNAIRIIILKRKLYLHYVSHYSLI